LAAIALGDIDIHCSLSSLCRERKPGASTLSQRPGCSGLTSYWQESHWSRSIGSTGGMGYPPTFDWAISGFTEPLLLASVCV
jgi:hypothetical protein